jgi:Domain of unknown function (DUF4375)
MPPLLTEGSLTIYRHINPVSRKDTIVIGYYLGSARATINGAIKMRINESYFKELLLRTKPLKAVSMLNQYWCTHLDRGEPTLLGLSEPEHHVHLCLIYTGEVGNGGHFQFFLNRGGDYTERALMALRAMGFSDLQDCLERACQVFTNGTVPWDFEEVERAIDSFSDEQLNRLHSLDKEVWSMRDIDERLLAYLRLHEGEILRQERGLTDG